MDDYENYDITNIPKSEWISEPQVSGKKSKEKSYCLEGEKSEGYRLVTKTTNVPQVRLHSSSVKQTDPNAKANFSLLLTALRFFHMARN